MGFKNINECGGFMNIFNKWLLVASLILSCTTVNATSKTQLYGSWKGVSGHSIKIHFTKDMKYVYQYKMLTFAGKWSVSGNNLTLNYRVLGSQKKKEATYSLRNGFLTLRAHEHATVVLKKL